MKKKKGISVDEEMVIEEFVNSMASAAGFVDKCSGESEDELKGVNSVGFDALVEMLQNLHHRVGEEKLEAMKEIIEMALDGDYRCPK